MESISNPAREAARARLAAAEAKREDILLYHIANGVNIESRTVEIDEGVVIAPGATILSGTILRGKTVIGANSVIGGNSFITESVAPNTKASTETPRMIFRVAQPKSGDDK